MPVTQTNRKWLGQPHKQEVARPKPGELTWLAKHRDWRGFERTRGGQARCPQEDWPHGGGSAEGASKEEFFTAPGAYVGRRGEEVGENLTNA